MSVDSPMNAPSRNTSSDPSVLLQAEIDGYRSLISLLAVEQEALRTADADALAKVVQAKLQKVSALQSMAVARVKALSATGCEETAAGIRRWLASGHDAGGAAEQWALLVGLAAGAQRSNELNQRLAAVQQRHFDRAIAALWQAAGKATIYGADGRSQHRGDSRTLASI